jgi:hypothetical protein
MSPDRRDENDAQATDDASGCLRFLKAGTNDELRHRISQAIGLVRRVGLGGYVRSIAGSLPIQGKRILEVGCHYCWYAPLFLEAGALAYHGNDLELDLAHREIAGPNGTIESPISFGQFIGAFECIAVDSCDIRDLPPTRGSYDAGFMISTSEHFDDPRGCFAALAALLSPGAPVFINHHNYYGWNGHHREPWRVRDFDPGNPDHQAVVDWRHVKQFGQNLSSSNYLNFIRMHELIAVVSEFFDVESKVLLKYDAESGAGRLTEEILASLPEYYREELETLQLCLTLRRRRDVGAPRRELAQRPTEHRYAIEVAWQVREAGHAFITRIPSLGDLGALKLFEDDRPLGPGGAMHSDIRERGFGSYSIWGNYLYFSTSDNSDPSTNGRRYWLRTGGDA